MGNNLISPCAPSLAAKLGIVIACLGCGVAASAQELKPIATLTGHEGSVQLLAFSPDGKRLASADGRVVKMWDVATGKATSTLNSIEFPCAGAALSSDRKLLASLGSCNSSLVLWNLETGKEIAAHEIPTDHSSPIVLFSPDGKFVAAGGRCIPEVGLWDVNGGRRIITIDEFGIYGPFGMTFTPEGKTIGGVSHEGVINFFDVLTGKKTSTVKISGKVSAAAFSRDCKTLAAASEDSDDVKLWEVASGKRLATLTPRGAGIHSWLALRFSPNGKLVAAADEDDKNTIQIWDVTTGKNRGSLATGEGNILCLAFSPDNKTLASGSEDKTVRLWDVSKLPPAGSR